MPDSPRVLNKRTDEIPPDAVYVGRPTQFGNPFVLKGEATRQHAVDCYREWLGTAEGQVIAVRAREQLRGKDLVCWCSPKACHADVLLAVANEDDTCRDERSGQALDRSSRRVGAKADQLTPRGRSVATPRD